MEPTHKKQKKDKSQEEQCPTNGLEEAIERVLDMLGAMEQRVADLEHLLQDDSEDMQDWEGSTDDSEEDKEEN